MRRLLNLALCGGAALVLVAIAAAQPAPYTLTATYTLPDLRIGAVQNAALPDTVANDRGMLVGGVGSDLWRGPDDPPGEYWMVTDRGPNGQPRIDGETRRTFPVPGFTPLILHVRTEGGVVNVLQTLPIVGQSGRPVTGLSNLPGNDEVPYDFSGRVRVDYNVNGLDTEGLVRTRAGDFWLVEEYSPSIVHVDASGRVVKRYIPQGLALTGTDYPVAQSLPAIFGKRKINRGFEGVAISRDERLLYAVLQSPLANPDRKTGDPSRNTRLLVFDIAAERPVAEYVYRFEVATQFDPDPKTAPDEMKLSAVVALDATSLLIDERTDNLARLYRVDLSAATNILGSRWDDPATAPSLEALADPADQGIAVLPKRLAVDLSVLPSDHGKLEGVALIDEHTVAIANDNDFDVGDFDVAGNNVGSGARSRIWIVQTAEPLVAPRGK